MGQNITATFKECHTLFLELEKNPYREAPELKKLFSYFDNNKKNVLEKNEAILFFECLYDFMWGREYNPYPLQNKQTTISEWCNHFINKDGVLLWEDFSHVVQLLANPLAIEKAELERTASADAKARAIAESRVFISDGKNIPERSKYIPLRMTADERKLLQILEGSLSASEYTDHVDVMRTRQKKSDIVKRQLQEMFGFICGLCVTHDIKLGHKLVNEDLQYNEEFYRQVFEIGRRHKILNPDKMRTTYGKMMFMLQDAVLLKVKVKTGIHNVHQFLTDRGASHLLQDPSLIPATLCFISSSPTDVKFHLDEKKKARENLVKKYYSEKITAEEINICIDSISDSNAHELANRHPIDRLLQYLHQYFDPRKDDPPFSLALTSGRQGSKLTHSHSLQFRFVCQSLQLWREIQHEMFRLWICADADLLSSSGYTLVNTGQGLNRIQSAKHVASLMSTILQRVKSLQQDDWVGLSVVHLGDHDVPNALFFIDKYTQVPHILAPIVKTIEGLGHLASRPGMEDFMSRYGGVTNACKKILCDFFKHGFDGSGDDGGSCVDGRLTSVWNWCSKIEKKDYYPLFLLTGFQGFDGNFKKMIM